MPDPLTIPPLDYTDPAVGTWLDAQPEVSDGLAIVDYLATAPDVPAAASDYGIDCALGELASTDPVLARGYIMAASDDLVDAAESYVADHGLLERHATLDDHACLVAQTMLELRGEADLYYAVTLLWRALDAGTLRACRRTVAR